MKENIKYICDDLGITIKELSDKIGIPYRTIVNYERGERKISSEFIEALVTHLGINSNWFLTNKGNVFINSSSYSSQNIEKISSKNDDLVDIPYYNDIRASAGTGVLNNNFETTIMQISMTFLMEYFGIMQTAKVEIIKISGNSMEPTIQPNQLVFVNRKEEYIVNGTIYIVRYYDDLLVKRVDRNPKTKAIRLISDNKEYNDILIENEDLEHFEVIGRVLGNLNSL